MTKTIRSRLIDHNFRKDRKAIESFLSNGTSVENLLSDLNLPYIDKIIGEIVATFTNPELGQPLAIEQDLFADDVRQLQKYLDNFKDPRFYDKIFELPPLYDQLNSPSVLFWRRSYAEIYHLYVFDMVQKVKKLNQLPEKERSKAKDYEHPSLVISGDPGVGKSVFSMLIFCFIAAARVTVIRVSETGSWIRAVDGKIDPVLHTDNPSGYRTPSTILLVDGKVRHQFLGKVTNAIVFCSSKKDNYHMFIKNCECRLIYMDPWSMEEIASFVGRMESERAEKCFKKVCLIEGIEDGKSIDWKERNWEKAVMDILYRRFVVVGGRIRLLLQHEHSISTLQTKLFQSMGTLTLADLNNFSAIDITNEVPSLCYSIVPRGTNREAADVSYCSPTAKLYAVFHHVWKKSEGIQNNYEMLTNSSVGSLIKGQLFEAVAHLVIFMAPNTNYEIRRLSDDSDQSSKSAKKNKLFNDFYAKMQSAKKTAEEMGKFAADGFCGTSRQLSLLEGRLEKAVKDFVAVKDELDAKKREKSDEKKKSDDDDDKMSAVGELQPGLNDLLFNGKAQDMTSIVLMSGDQAINNYEPTFFRSSDSAFQTVVSKSKV